MTDDQLKKHFDALRGEEADSFPSYAQVLTRESLTSRSRANSSWLRVALPAFAAAVVMLWFTVPRQTIVDPEAPQQFAPVRWAMPTDVLLTTPGSELLREVPALGTKALLPEPLLGPDKQWGSHG